MPIDKVILPEDAKSEDQELSSTLTKAAHRNPDIHERGDTLPESLLEYQEGSATLFPDIAGNQPVILRRTETAYGPGGLQAVTDLFVPIAGLNTVVTVPPQAGTPRIKVSFHALILCNAGPGPAANRSDFEAHLYVNGVPHGTRMYMGIAFSVNLAGTPVHSWIPYHRSNLLVAASPGQTISLEVRVIQSFSTASSNNNYSINNNPADTQLTADLYY